MQIIDYQRENKLGISVFHRHWNVPEAKAVVCIVHGMGEHIGRYGHVAEFLSVQGFSTIGFDHQGHGRTVGKRGHAAGLDAMLDDISNLLEQARELYPERPLLLYGHSMGGNLALNHVLRRKPDITGVVVTAPWIRLPNPPSKLKVFFAKLANHILPKLTQPNGLDVNGLSNDKAVIEAYQNDPLVHDRVSVRVGVDLLDAAQFLDTYKGALPCPTLLMHGLNDPLTSPAATEAFAERNPSNVTWKGWPGLKHEIHNEPQQGEVLAFLVEWLRQVC